MTQRTKLELEINKPTELTLLFDEPITGRNQYGEYFMYAVAVGESEYSFFATAEINAELSKLSKGNKAIITKLAAQRGNKIVTSYEVKAISDINTAKDQDSFNSQEPSEASDSFFDMMLKSYRDALKISQELNGMADPEKIAVTLFIARSRSQ